MSEDVEPQRMSVLDVASLTASEVYGILTVLAGDPSPEVTAALIDAVRRILARTRHG